jgi:hypothetical protein
MKKLIVSVTDNRVTYVITDEKGMDIYDISKQEDNLVTHKDVITHLVPSSVASICEDFALQMINNHIIFTPTDFIKLSGGIFADYQICIIDNLTKYTTEESAPTLYIKRN